MYTKIIVGFIVTVFILSPATSVEISKNHELIVNRYLKNIDHSKTTHLYSKQTSVKTDGSSNIYIHRLEQLKGSFENNKTVERFKDVNKDEIKIHHEIRKRTIDIDYNDSDKENGDIETDVESEKANMTPSEDCVGLADYCNMSKEEYVSMLQDYIYPQTYEWVLIATHTTVFIIGLVGNALVCIAVYRNHTMRTVTNYFIVNLAAADFMVILFCLPPTVLWDVTETWFLGNTLCKVLLYFQSVSVTVSVLTLTFISVDRWYAICFPLKFKSTTGRAKTAILVIWAISLLFNSPELIVLETVQMVPLRFNLQYLVQCMATWSPTSEVIWHILKVLLIYTIPLLLMTIAYHQIVRVLWKNEKIPGQAETVKLASAEQTQLRSRRKAAKMLVAVVIMFAVCYFPIHLLCILRYTMDMEQNDAVTFLALVSHVMCYANSAINPLIYNFMSGKFRREFRRSFWCSNSSVPENFTTLSRLTTSKTRRQCTHADHRSHMCTTHFIHNHYTRDCPVYD
ncbi:unnamed protein product [Chilo suppressalis]|uniref:G-protein coupled receptors family 1 profile domain-containing protein n=1 Tax=Chilo suppressalis TaxID=168631 RepID=A0ABN8B8Z4_CHISP|nr:hypothetical protein evm_008408 [Chilo suppressalis]CAH0403079.1 unnamed protein product [Chilo suppressalis]